MKNLSYPLPPGSLGLPLFGETLQFLIDWIEEQWLHLKRDELASRVFEDEYDLALLSAPSKSLKFPLFSKVVRSIIACKCGRLPF